MNWKFWKKKQPYEPKFIGVNQMIIPGKYIEVATKVELLWFAEQQGVIILYYDYDYLYLLLEDGVMCCKHNIGDKIDEIKKKTN